MLQGVSGADRVSIPPVATPFASSGTFEPAQGRHGVVTTTSSARCQCGRPALMQAFKCKVTGAQCAHTERPCHICGPRARCCTGRVRQVVHPCAACSFELNVAFRPSVIMRRGSRCALLARASPSCSHTAAKLNTGSQRACVRVHEKSGGRASQHAVGSTATVLTLHLTSRGAFLAHCRVNASAPSCGRNRPGSTACSPAPCDIANTLQSSRVRSPCCKLCLLASTRGRGATPSCRPSRYRA